MLVARYICGVALFLWMLIGVEAAAHDREGMDLEQILGEISLIFKNGTAVSLGENINKSSLMHFVGQGELISDNSDNDGQKDRCISILFSGLYNIIFMYIHWQINISSLFWKHSKPKYGGPWKLPPRGFGD